MRISLAAILTAVPVLLRCSPSRERIPPVPKRSHSQNKIVIYQLMTRLFGNTTAVNKPNGTLEENGVGKFSDINNRALEGIKELGATTEWANSSCWSFGLMRTYFK